MLQESSRDTLPQLHELSDFMLRSELDGSKGSNRPLDKTPHIRARHDYEALQCWLNEYKHKETTFRTYQKEAERFLLWSLLQQQKPLSSLTRDDLENYIQFLDCPFPKELWCSKKGGRGHKRGTPNWRPFSGPLSLSAKTTALSVIDSLFSYLVDAQYLLFNPLSLIKKHKFIQVKNHENALKIQERILEIDEWRCLLDTLDNMTETDMQEKQQKERLRLLVALLYFLGLRINELASHCWNAFRKLDDRWWFFVTGKGNKLAKVPVNDELLRIIITYRAFLHRSPLPSAEESLPLIASLDGKSAISARQINKLLKKLAVEAMKQYTHQPEKAKKLKKFSAHWLRHLSASMQDRSGVAFKHIRSNLRHENDDTTRLYVHALDEERHQDMQKLTLRKK